MGVKNLWDILESCKKTLPLHHLQNKRVCIDLSCWMVQLHNVNKSHCSLKEKVYLKGLFHRLRALIALNCSLVFVTDGSIPAIKLSTYRRRLNSGNEVAQDESSSQNASSLPRNMGSEFSRMIKEAKTLGTALGIPCLDGIEEAEAQCALLNSESLCVSVNVLLGVFFNNLSPDSIENFINESLTYIVANDGCFTSDSDVFLFGARTVYREICLGEGGYVVCYEMADIERTLGFGRNTLITLALLLGCDYSHGVHGIGQELACRIVKEVGDDVILKKIASEGLLFVKKAKRSKKKGKGSSDENLPINNIILNGNECDTNGDNKFLQVIDAYLKPRCHSLDSDVVHRALSLYPFERTRLQEICAQFFEWPPEKTDEYILPKIAERDLRRFSNLRATSSDLGVQLPLDKMPVKCPMSRIIKHRKANGKDCFEVNWDKFDGLESSIVPADLVESACPEKIREFEEKKAEGKKRNQKKSRKQKTESTAPMAELDHKLQDLLLDINCASNSTTNIRKDVDVFYQSQHLDKVSEFENDRPNASEDCYTNGPSLKTYESASTCYGTGSVIIDLLSPPRTAGARGNCYTSGPSSSHQSEFIDLLSPSPPVRARKVSKGHEAIAQKVDIIDLIESDLEASPEHAQKAMELRSFIASIRDEIS